MIPESETSTFRNTRINVRSPNVRLFQAGAQPRMVMTISNIHTTFPVTLEHPIVFRAFQNVYSRKRKGIYTAQLFSPRKKVSASVFNARQIK